MMRKRIDRPDSPSRPNDKSIAVQESNLDSTGLAVWQIIVKKTSMADSSEPSYGAKNT